MSQLAIIAKRIKSQMIHTVPSASAIEALTLMQEKSVHHLLVITPEGVVGMVSDRDLWKKAVKRDLVLDFTAVKVSDAMRTRLPTLTEASEVGEAIAFMKSHSLSAIPVVQNEELVALVTESDVLKILGSSDLSEPSALDKAEVAMANPLVQNLLNALSSVGI